MEGERRLMASAAVLSTTVQRVANNNKNRINLQIKLKIDSFIARLHEEYIGTYLVGILVYLGVSWLVLGPL